MPASPHSSNPERVTLVPVGADDWRDVSGLKVTEAQRAFVAEPADYLALCADGGVWNPVAVRLGERVIGFVMWAIDPEDESCWLGGLLIDARHQRQGHGRRTLEAVLDLLVGDHGRRDFALAYHPDNPAKSLYQALGFRETGEVDGDEVVARWSVPA
jgi:diamine N-acetyltransferase